MKEGYVYIIQSEATKSYYIGSTANLEQRLFKHNQGATTSTRHKRPWKLVFSQRYENINQARKVEYRLKKFKSRIIIERIIKKLI